MAESEAPVSPYFFSQGRPREPLFQIANSLDAEPAERYGDWLQSMLYNFELARPDQRQARDFRASIISLAAAGGELHDMQSDDFAGYRSRGQIRKNEDNKLALVYVMRGRVSSIHEGDGERVAGPGQFLLFDAQRPSRMHFTQHRFVQLNLPRVHVESLFAGKVPAPSQVGEALSASRLSPLLAIQLRQFAALAGRLNQTERLGLLDATETLALTILENACLDGGYRAAGRSAGLHIAAQRYIRLHLASPELSPQRIAAALGCSRATLYRAFAQQGVSIAEHIRELRLRRLAELLRNPDSEHPIAVLAQRCGLDDTPNLSRMFRQRFGVTPREFRAASAYASRSA